MQGKNIDGRDRESLQEICGAIHRDSLEMSTAAEFPAAVERVLARMQDAGLTFTSFTFHLMEADSESQSSTLYVLHPAPVSWLGAGPEPVEAAVAATGRVESWQDEKERPRWHLAVPTVLGVATIADDRERDFSAREQALLTLLAGAVEALVARHRDLRQLEAARMQVVQVDAELVALHDGSFDLSGETQEEVARKIIGLITSRLGFERTGIFLVDRAQDALRGGWGVDEEGQVVPIPQTVFPLYPEDRGALSEAAEVARGDLPYFLSQDLDGEGRHSVEGDIRANLTVPMRVGDRIIGALAVDNYPNDRPISTHQVQPLMILANQGAAALENARLHQVRGVVESLDEGLLIADAGGKILYTNAYLSQLTGFPRQEWTGRTLEQASVRLPLTTGFHEVEIQCLDGLSFWGEVRVGPYRDTTDEMVGTLVRIRDVTRRRQAEQEVERQRSLSLRADRLRSLGEMAAGIAHELNQPLVGVRGLAEHVLIGMERGWELNPDRLRERMDSIIEQADRMVHIIQHVRMFARQSGQPEVKEVAVGEVVESSLELLQAQFRARGVELRGRVGEGIPPVLANRFSLEEVLLNLLSNARDAVEERMAAAPDGTGRVQISAEVGEEEGRRAVVIAVEDDGGGISNEILDRVFEPFFTTKDPDRGTGLGLAISRSIVEEFGGRLKIRSTPGQGTVVSLWLPAHNREEG